MTRKAFFILLASIFFMADAAAWGAPRQETAQRAVRVACVGNSVTYGYGIANRERDSYPAQLQRMLGQGYEVKNFGHSGATLLTKGHRPYIKLPEFRQALDYAPDWVVIHLGLNDTDPRNWPDWKEDFIPDYRALIDSFRTANAEARILVCLMTPIFDRHPRFQSGTRDWHAQIQEAIRQVARGSSAQLIDLFTPLHSRPDLFPDALHPNPEGAGILARTVFGALTGNYGGLRLPPVYSSGMVLPRDEHLLLEGRADARRSIKAVLSRDGKVVEERKSFSRADGTWRMEFPHMPAGGPYTLSFTATPLNPDQYHIYYPDKYPYFLENLTKSEEQTLTIDSLYFGDLWLASGQSNMELRVDQCNTLDQDLSDAARLAGRLHLYNMPARARTDAVEWDDSVLRYTNQLRHMEFQGWKNASPEIVRRFSAVAFNFGRVLCDSLPDVPIGIICNAVGGSTTESWIDRSTLEWEFPNILRDWRNGDFGQAWARGRMTQNIAHALDKESPAYNPLQRHPYDPAYLFEAAIEPLGHLPIKGVIWYQGESNAHNIEAHEQLFTLLEQSWRKHFARRWNCEFQKKPELPFYTVQLSSLPRPSWPAFRDSQRRLAQSLPNTGMVVTSDLGDKNDVHYRTKRPVGERLALQALRHTYGHRLESEGPTLRYADDWTDGTVVLQFDHANGLSCTRGFEISGPDGMFYPANIQIDGDKITLSSPSVKNPSAVRYGWSGFTDADLRNASGLPASTFQVKIPYEGNTDDTHAKGGRFASLKMPCRLLSGITERDYGIYLPGCYNPESKQTYPVLYLMHGGGGSHTDFEQQQHVSQLADSLIAAGIIQPMIIVCPEGNRQNMMYFNAEKGKRGAPDWRYEDYFFQELIPYIEQTYHGRQDKGGRAIAGFSMGGGAATVYGVHHPELFSMVYDISGYLRSQPLEFLKNDPSARWRQWVIDQNDPIKRIEKGSPEEIEAWKTVDWKVAVGDFDFTIESNMDLIRAFRKQRILYDMFVDKGYHNGIWVQSCLEDVLIRADRNFRR